MQTFCPAQGAKSQHKSGGVQLLHGALLDHVPVGPDGRHGWQSRARGPRAGTHGGMAGGVLRDRILHQRKAQSS